MGKDCKNTAQVVKELERSHKDTEQKVLSRIEKEAQLKSLDRVGKQIQRIKTKMPLNEATKKQSSKTATVLERYYKEIEQMKL